MKLRSRPILILALTLAGATGVRAQTYTVDWYKIAGGGGTSTNGTYQVSGTVGQPDAGATMSGGNYAVDGGFWSIIAAVQLPGAPLLVITPAGTNAVISWPSPSPGYVLQQNSNLATTNWLPVGPAPSDNGTTKSLTVTALPGNTFFRLKK